MRFERDGRRAKTETLFRHGPIATFVAAGLCASVACGELKPNSLASGTGGVPGAGRGGTPAGAGRSGEFSAGGDTNSAGGEAGAGAGMSSAGGEAGAGGGGASAGGGAGGGGGSA